MGGLEILYFIQELVDWSAPRLDRRETLFAIHQVEGITSVAADLDKIFDRRFDAIEIGHAMACHLVHGSACVGEKKEDHDGERDDAQRFPLTCFSPPDQQKMTSPSFYRLDLLLLSRENNNLYEKFVPKNIPIFLSSTPFEKLPTTRFP